MIRVLRFALFIALVTVVQVSVFTHLRAFGVVPDLGLLVAVGVAYRAGPEAGAIAGFAAGLAYDLFLETPIGLSALAWALTAFLVGRMQSGMLRTPRGFGVLLGGASAIVGGLLFVGIGILAGVAGLRDPHALEVVGIAGVYDALIAPFVFLLVAWVLGAERAGTETWSIR